MAASEFSFLHPEDSYQAAINHSFIVSITNKAGEIIYANDQFCNYSEYSREELLGRNHRIINSGYHSDDFFKQLWKTINSGKTWRGEIRNKSKNGNYYWVDTVITPLFDHERKIQRFLSVRNIITDKKEIEAALKESEEFNIGILSSITSHIAVINDQGKILKTNKAWEDFSNESKEFWHLHCNQGSNYLSYLAKLRNEGIDLAGDALQGIYSVIKGESASFKMECPYSSGKKWFQLNVVAYGEETQKILVRFAEITDRKNIELQLTRLVNELTNRNNELMQFNYIVSHNLRSPIAQLTGLCNIIGFPNLEDDEKQKIIDYIRNSAQKMDELIKDLSRVLSARSTVHQVKEKINFRSLIKSILDTLSQQIEDTQSLILTNIAEDSREIYTVKPYLESILFNLISNAIKYRSEKRTPKINVSISKTNEHYLIVVSDNGVGIDLDMHGKQIFGLYRRFHEHIEGKGLGLYMTKTQAEALGGQIEIKSKQDEGTTITVKLPFKLTNHLSPPQKASTSCSDTTVATKHPK